VAEGDGARLFRVGDAADAARALGRALGNPAWAAAARARNRAVVEAARIGPRNMARVEALFASLIGQPGVAPHRAPGQGAR